MTLEEKQENLPDSEHSSANSVQEQTQHSHEKFYTYVWMYGCMDDVWNSNIDLKAELDLGLDACDGIQPTSFICCRHLNLCYTQYSPCRETGAVGLDQALIFLDEMNYIADVPVPLGRMESPGRCLAQF